MDSIRKYMDTIRHIDRISKSREKELSRIILNSKDENEVDNSKDELIKSNLRLVVHRAFKIHRNYNKRLPLLDLIAEGNIGLMRAASKYDADREKSSAFSTYAVMHIDSNIRKFILSNRLIYIPEYHFSYQSKIRKMEAEHGKELTDDMIKEELDISDRFLKIIRCGVESGSHSLEDMHIYEGGSKWCDMMEDDKIASPSDETNSSILSGYLESYFEELSERERNIVKRMFYDEDSPTLEKLSKELGVTKERVRQISHRALKKLRNIIMLDWDKVHGDRKEKSIGYYIDTYERKYRNFNDAFTTEDARRIEEEIEEERKKFKKILNFFLN